MTGHLPVALTVNEIALGPGTLLRGIAQLFLALHNGSSPNSFTLAPGPEEPAIARELADALLRRLPQWPPHRPDLLLDRLVANTRLQSWSLKPAAMTT
jgi:hypothetical protein